MSEPLVPPRLLFRLAVPCYPYQGTWTTEGITLGTKFRLPSFAALDGAPTLADVRVAWNQFGLYFHIRVEGKRQSPWCRETQLDESDRLHVWTDIAKELAAKYA